MSQFTSHSPPPLRHPVPTHPAYIPEPPSTPASPQSYQRFSSSPAPPNNAPQHLHASPAFVSAYTSPFQHTQQQSRHPEPIRQPLGQAGPGIPLPDMNQWGINDATTQFGMQLGHSAVAAGQDYVQKNFGSFLPGISAFKHHFNVSNSYVIKKISILVFPWLHKPWHRRIRRLEHGQTEWQPPRDDVNSPDLYIPLMAILTYILLAASLSKERDPKVLGECASRALGIVMLDSLFVRIGCYALNIQGSNQIIDLIAYGGYKFVGVILALAASILPVFSLFWKLVFIYAFLANAFFLLRSLRSVVFPDPSVSSNPTTTTTSAVSTAQKRRRVTFLFLEAVLQIVYMFILVRVG